VKISVDTAEHYSWGSGCDGWHLVKQPALSIIQERMPPGTSEARHFHAVARQFFFVIEGTLTIESDGVRYELTTGEGLEIPAKTVHQVFNIDGGPTDFLVVSQPASHGDRVLS
jgi:mannose-6-phosphate isomerase-like protein (cupin superfamily)